jgi:prepilin-type N-terminal cleavage/methylation domain-containing protein/prepilin-type processing-associated H-X9-DG protein
MVLSPRRRGGFTLIELLVVIAIIAVLIGMLLPAVQKVREAASRSSCSNNMHQLVLAAQHYHDNNGKLPPAAQMNASVTNVCTDGQNFGPNWAVILLPYIEQAPLFATVQNSVRDYMTTGDNTWRSIRGASIPTLRCPSDGGQDIPCSRAGGGWARGNYAANAGPAFWNQTVNGSSPNAGYGVPGGGVMCVNWGATMTELTNGDGTTQTIMFNEVRIGPADSDRRGTWAMGFPGASVTAANAIGDCTTPNDQNSGSDDVEGCTNKPEIGMGCWTGCQSNQAQARSMHTGGVNAAFCDGSVRFVGNAIQQEIWYYMNSRNDAVPYDQKF